MSRSCDGLSCNTAIFNDLGSLADNCAMVTSFAHTLSQRRCAVFLTHAACRSWCVMRLLHSAVSRICQGNVYIGIIHLRMFYQCLPPKLRSFSMVLRRVECFVQVAQTLMEGLTQPVSTSATCMSQRESPTVDVSCNSWQLLRSA